jgi:gamma-glutamyltranspeptidase
MTQMLNVLEGFDIGGLGFGTAENIHLLAEALKLAFADRGVATADPAFVKVPVERLTSKDYAAERRAMLKLDTAQAWAPGVPRPSRPIPPMSRWPIPWATWSPPPRPSTACSAHASASPAPG